MTAPVRPPETAAIVVIGDEVLTGKVADCNSPWLLRELFALGVRTRTVRVVADAVDEIAGAVRECAACCEVVFTSGGIGPTHDDVTYAGVAAAFGRPLRQHPALVERLRAYYGERLNAARLRMAEIPDPDELCLAEGMLAPVVRVANVYVLPGVPELLRRLFGALRERFRLRPVYIGQLFTNQSEGELAAALNAVVARHPQVRIGSYPRLDPAPHRVQLVVESYCEAAAAAAFDDLAAALDPRRLVEHRPVAVVGSPGRRTSQGDE
ncbi:MAG: competence/damage-inducible protein A [Deltaproteobacteria bacterium]|nr:competence/damage-inducible protein A [Deltaproteobacteria bacterium]